MPRITVNPADLIAENSTYHKGGHQTCTLATVKIGQYPIGIALANWKLDHMDPFPRTHWLAKKCDFPGCVSSKCHAPEPIKKAKPPSDEPTSIRDLWARLQASEAKREALERRVTELEAAEEIWQEDSSHEAISNSLLQLGSTVEKIELVLRDKLGVPLLSTTSLQDPEDMQ